MHETFQGGALTEVTFYILLSVYRPNHGYGIMRFIEDETGGRLVPGPGTLYGAIRALLKKGWIEPFDEEGEENKGKKEYRITSSGRRAAEAELLRLKELCRTAEKITGGAEP
jgi:DNA-binding PadR family transcriptional regulator